jgi:peptidoglycan/LPS O-acetylase OafA/YrhL
LRFESLDSLRGLAAISIAIFHVTKYAGGYLAVDFFLVLSGFVLSHSYLYKYSPVTAVEFISHRISRLYPLHVFTLFTFVIVFILINKTWPQSKDGNIFTFIQHLTLMQNIGFNPRGMTYNYPSWSISVEFWVNILFILYVTKATRTSTLFLIAMIGLLAIYNITGHLDTHNRNYFRFVNSGMLRGISSFFLGIISYRMYLYFKGDDRRKMHINALQVLSIVGVLLVIFARKGMTSEMDFIAPFMFMFAVTVFAFETGFLSRYLRFGKYLGTISYSVYLNQITVLMLVHYTLDKYGLPLIVIVFVHLSTLLVVSHFTYQYIEKPLQKRCRNLLASFGNRMNTNKIKSEPLAARDK